MDFFSRIKNIFSRENKGLNNNVNNYQDKVIFYCSIGMFVSCLFSLGFNLRLRSTLLLGIGIPLGYLHKDLMKFVDESVNTNNSNFPVIENKEISESNNELKNITNENI